MDFNLRDCGQPRRLRIDQADRLVTRANDLIDEAEAAGCVKAANARRRKAAILMEKSAAVYRRAGLGVCAATSWDDAADLWSEIGDTDRVRQCEAESGEIDTFWEEAINE